MTHERATISNQRPRLASQALTAALLGVTLILAGCGDKGKVASDGAAPPPPPPPAAAAPSVTPAPPPPLPTPGIGPRERYKLSLDLLQRGKDAQARAELVQLQKDLPSDRRAGVLLRQIDTDPKQLYGTDSFAYTMQAGDTLFSLARQYLKDALNFYGLARYNGLTLPVDLKPGQVILIPGRARAPDRGAPRHAVTPPPAVAVPHPQAAPADNPAQRAQAQNLRRQGLEQMSAGSIDRAVTLLSQAASLDPANPAIAADLARARRIQATVHSQ